MAQRDVTADVEIHLAPDTHVLVRRRGVPIDPGQTQIIFSRGKYFDGQRIVVRMEKFCEVEFKGAVRASDFVLAGDFLAVDPDVRAVIDSKKLKPSLLGAQAARSLKFHAEPVR